MDNSFPRIPNLLALPSWLSGKESACKTQETLETWVRSLGQEDPPEKGMSTPVFLPGEFHGQRNLTGYSPWGCKEPDTAEQLTLSL